MESKHPYQQHLWELSSDGYPHDDMMASIAVWYHENIIPFKGQLTNHPDEGRQWIVLKKLDTKKYSQLFLPPNFETISRDVVQDVNLLTIEQAHSIAKNVSSGLAHMHDKWIAHGDLYGHNILSNYKELHSVFWDFWAASIYDRTQQRWRENIDVRGFWNLLSDLMIASGRSEGLDKHDLLRWLCLSKTPSHRPSMRAINDYLNNI